MTQLRAVMLGLALFLPMLSLVPLGSLWLWQNGFLFHWLAGALAVTALFYAFESWALPSSRAKPTRASRGATDIDATPGEVAAWGAVARLSGEIEPAKIQSRSDVTALAIHTIDAVAREIHPGDKSPVWNFTIPEILLLTERVAARLRPIVIDTIPLGEQLTVGQALRLYEWRSAAGVAGKIYDIWRLLRILNPVAAATQEARERITKQIVVSVRDDLTKRILGVFVTEVGAAAIDLYGGRLKERPAGETNRTDGTVPIPAETVTGSPPPKPSRISRVWREATKVSATVGRLYGRKPGNR